MPSILDEETNLVRQIQPMPEDIRQRFEERAVLDDYHSRPAYQQNDYLAWIGRAKRPETREKRINQMLDELDRGGIYMKMDHPVSERGPS